MNSKELKAVYELRDIISKINWNECHDHNNPERADIRKKLYTDGLAIADEIINKYPVPEALKNPTKNARYKRGENGKITLTDFK